MQAPLHFILFLWVVSATLYLNLVALPDPSKAEWSVSGGSYCPVVVSENPYRVVRPVGTLRAFQFRDYPRSGLTRIAAEYYQQGWPFPFLHRRVSGDVYSFNAWHCDILGLECEVSERTFDPIAALADAGIALLLIFAVASARPNGRYLCFSLSSLLLATGALAPLFAGLRVCGPDLMAWLGIVTGTLWATGGFLHRQPAALGILFSRPASTAPPPPH
jgi:hypothetical protein